MTTATALRRRIVKKQSVVSFPTKPLPQARNIVIEGVDTPHVRETRMALDHKVSSTASKYCKPRSQPVLKTSQKTIQQNIQKPAQNLAKEVYHSKKSFEASFRLIETKSRKLEVMMTVKSVAAGLKNGETVLLVSPEPTEKLIKKIGMTGLNVNPFINSGKLIILNSQRIANRNLDQMTSYREILGGLVSSAKYPVDRMVILNMDKMVNLKSDYLATTTVGNFIQVAEEIGCKIIAQYSHDKSAAHARLERACGSLVSSYYTMTDGKQHNNYQLKIKNKLPALSVA